LGVCGSSTTRSPHKEELVAHATRQHPNAPPEGRRRMVACLLEQRLTVEQTAERFQVDAETVRKWRDRFLAEGDAGLRDRSSRPHRSPRRTCHRGGPVRTCATRCCGCVAASPSNRRPGSRDRALEPTLDLGCVFRRVDSKRPDATFGAEGPGDTRRSTHERRPPHPGYRLRAPPLRRPMCLRVLTTPRQQDPSCGPEPSSRA
jgi:transposase-like protein